MNIFIGSYYFKHLLSNNKSYVEAIASYNAGPSVVRKWRKAIHAPEDAWIEFIPYSETRKYVKLVLEYSLVYDWVLNKKNGEVEAVLINTDAALFKTILSNCFLGPKKSIVENILVEDFALKKIETSTFEIKK